MSGEFSSPIVGQILQGSTRATDYSGMSDWGSGPLGSGTYGLNADYLTVPGNINQPFMAQMGAAPLQMPQPPMVAMGNDRPVDLGAGGGGDRGFWGSMLSHKNVDGTVDQGWGSMALGAAGGLAQAFMGMKQYGLAKEQLAEGKRQFEQNYAAQRQTTNTALEDRQRARVASNPGAYQSVGAYMGQNGIR